MENNNLNVEPINYNPLWEIISNILADNSINNSYLKYNSLNKILHNIEADLNINSNDYLYENNFLELSLDLDDEIFVNDIPEEDFLELENPIWQPLNTLDFINTMGEVLSDALVNNNINNPNMWIKYLITLLSIDSNFGKISSKDNFLNTKLKYTSLETFADNWVKSLEKNNAFADPLNFIYNIKGNTNSEKSLQDYTYRFNTLLNTLYPKVTKSESVKNPLNIPYSDRYKEFNNYFDDVIKENPDAAKFRSVLTGLAKIESDFIYNIRNKRGKPAYGYFLFWEGPGANNVTYYGKTTVNKFLNDPKLQIKAAVKLMKDNLNSLTNADYRRANKLGLNSQDMLAIMWFSGLGGLRKYLKGKELSDGATTISQYVRRFRKIFN